MKFGLNVPQFEAFGNVHTLVQMAQEAESTGWDAFLLWDHILFDDLWHPMADPWIALAAIAANTSRMRLGTMITPLARRRPWKVAREATTLDHLSNGRFILGVGLGDPAEWEYGFFGEETDARVRAEKLDEALDILDGLWSGSYFSYTGKHFQLEEMRFLPRPVQQPRIPIWVGGYWPRKRPLQRAAKWDGVCPGGLHGPLTPDDWREILATIQQHRIADSPFEAVHGGTTSGDNPDKDREKVAAYAAAGVTWWIEDLSPYGRGLGWAEKWTPEIVDKLWQRLRQGPPNL
jgi:alkanesulfonate monooxygenase SsuD/methylene tetrahydromethanopterin reductase-like flavin-dependent oxidoreductase (luciferase family)